MKPHFNINHNYVIAQFNINHILSIYTQFYYNSWKIAYE